MKFITLITILVVILVATTSAQRRRCPQRPRPSTCVGVRNLGSRCPTAPPRRMWYYNQANRTCIAMNYLGCGGNSNRWCTRRSCQMRCVSPN